MQSATVALHRAKDAGTATWSLAYGELTAGGFGKVVRYMRDAAPERLRTTSESSFLDIGSGYGKCVFHASIAAPFLRSSAGIECMSFRCDRSRELAERLRTAGALGARVDIACGDATGRESFPQTHIFEYDYAFSDVTLAALLPIVQRSRPLVFVSFAGPSRVRKFGAPQMVLLDRMRCRSTGGQNPTAYAYTHEAHVEGRVEGPPPRGRQGQPRRRR